MSAIFKTDSGIFNSLEANEVSITGQITISGQPVATESYVTNITQGGINYSSEINSLSGKVDLATGDISQISGAIQVLINEEVSDDSRFNTISGKVDLATGDISQISGAIQVLINEEVSDDSRFNTISGKVDLATGDISQISGAIQVLINEEVSDDSRFNTISGKVDLATGDISQISGAIQVLINEEVSDDSRFNTISGKVDLATGDISQISGFVQNLSANLTTYSDTDVANYLDGNLDAHIIPDTNSTYDIGSAEYKIRHLYLSNNSLYIGNTSISSTEQGEITFPSGINASGINISGSIGGVNPSQENNSIQWDSTEKKWKAGDKITKLENNLTTTSGDLYSFYKPENNTISNVSGSFNKLNFQNYNTPENSNSIGSKGEITYDNDYMYICVSGDLWKRVALSDF
jgi:lysyl-tRNA synthetase class II